MVELWLGALKYLIFKIFLACGTIFYCLIFALYFVTKYPILLSSQTSLPVGILKHHGNTIFPWLVLFSFNSEFYNYFLSLIR